MLPDHKQMSYVSTLYSQYFLGSTLIFTRYNCNFLLATIDIFYSLLLCTGYFCKLATFALTTSVNSRHLYTRDIDHSLLLYSSRLLTNSRLLTLATLTLATNGDHGFILEGMLNATQMMKISSRLGYKYLQQTCLRDLNAVKLDQY